MFLQIDHFQTFRTILFKKRKLAWNDKRFMLFFIALLPMDGSGEPKPTPAPNEELPRELPARRPTLRGRSIFHHLESADEENSHLQAGDGVLLSLGPTPCAASR